MAMQVFLSHSAGDVQADADFVEDLHERLLAVKADDGSPQFEVFFDRDNLRAADPWRQKLFDFLGACHGGVVVLNERAIQSDKYPWVHTEASILRWRTWMGEQLPLVLMLRGAGSQALYAQRKEWEPLAFGEVQFLGARKEFVDATLDTAAFDVLVAQLKASGVANDGTRYGQLREALRSEIKRIPFDEPGVAEWTKRLLAEGPAGLSALIDKKGYLSDEAKQAIETALDLIAPWWIDVQSSARLASAATDPALSTFAVNGSRTDYTPLMYVRQACCLSANVAWKVLPILGNSGTQGTQAFLDSIVAEVRRVLKSAFPKVWPPTEEVSDEDMNELIDSLLGKQRRPTFIALPPHLAADKTVADAVHAVFPNLKLIALTRTPEQAAAIAHAVPLTPLPDPALEKSERERFRDIRAILS
jgi:hypothetical protein